MAAVESIAVSACVAGVLDIAATGTVMRAQGTPFVRLLQFVASGALGGRAFAGGGKTAGIGLVLHFLIAAVWAVIYYAASDGLPVLPTHPLLCGAVFGVVVHLVMSRVVVPLSRTQKRPFAWRAWLTQLAIHVVFVGVPIALTQSYLAR
jgi:uncharacterized membrane protein YagU involved in acid resistance